MSIASLRIMGIVNVTPDSFSDGGRYSSVSAAVMHGRRLVDDGADILDVGGESTRPGAQPVSTNAEISRVIPVIAELRRQGVRIPISVDTSKSLVARQALDAGASMVNDVSAGMADPDMMPLCAERSAPMVLMHMRGVPLTMQEKPAYQNVVEDVASWLHGRVMIARKAGVERVYVDPGIGFGKSVEHNLQLLRALHRFHNIAPVVVGLSRKSFLGSLIGIEDPAERDVATAIMHSLLAHSPVSIIRVHNVALLQTVRNLAAALWS